MKFWSRVTLVVTGLTCAWITGVVMVGRVSAQAPTRLTAGQAFKNVTTSTLKELPVDDFIQSMGIIASALGFDCSDCHPGAGTDKVDWVFDTPRKRTARRMVEMVATINRANFGGGQRVTCWTCHHGRTTPATSVALDNWYGSPNSEVDDVVAEESDQPSVDQVLKKYIDAIGGAQRLAGLTSFVATGEALGFGGFGGGGEWTVYAKRPSQRTTIITYKDHPDRGKSVWTFDGSAGWMGMPRSLLGSWEQVGGDLDGARFEAQMSFPGNITQYLTNLRVGARRAIGDRDYRIVQGSGPRGFLATFYFDQDTGLLARMIRLSPTPIGRMQIQTDFADYRDVGGIKFPFEHKYLWLDGRYTAKVKEIKVNAPIDAVNFGQALVK